MNEMNPYQAPNEDSVPSANSWRTIRRTVSLDGVFICVASVCGIGLAGYGTLGAVFNVMNLSRPLSVGDAITEAWLVFVMLLGLAIYAVIYFVRKKRLAIDPVDFSVVTIFTTVVVMALELHLAVFIEPF